LKTILNKVKAVVQNNNQMAVMFLVRNHQILLRWHRYKKSSVSITFLYYDIFFLQ